MATYDHELLQAASGLIRRRKGQRGKLAAARIRRSVSTSHYVLFHFILDEAARTLIGTYNDLRPRRRTVARTFSHAGIKTALDKIRGQSVDQSVADLLGPRDAAPPQFRAPPFARDLATAFPDAQSKRLEANYDLNKTVTEADARLLITRVLRVIAAWRGADTTNDKDFMHALCLLMLLKGQVRREN